MSHRFNLLGPIDLDDYKKYIQSLRSIGCTEVEHSGIHLRFPTQKTRAREIVDIIHQEQLTAVLYTGIFGTVNLNNHPQLQKYAQRDKNNNILSIIRSFACIKKLYCFFIFTIIPQIMHLGN